MAHRDGDPDGTPTAPSVTAHQRADVLACLELNGYFLGIDDARNKWTGLTKFENEEHRANQAVPWTFPFHPDDIDDKLKEIFNTKHHRGHKFESNYAQWVAGAQLTSAAMKSAFYDGYRDGMKEGLRILLLPPRETSNRRL